MSALVQNIDEAKELIEKIKIEVLSGNIANLDDKAKANYIITLCETLGLNHLTQPFSFMVFNGKYVLYANKSASEQLRALHKVSIESLETRQVNDIFLVTATAQTPDGRKDSSTGAVCIKGLSGEALANALMKAETKAKRRVTLSICGLGILDESELETMKEKNFTRAELPKYDELALKNALNALFENAGLKDKELKREFVAKMGFHNLELLDKALKDEAGLNEQIKQFINETKEQK